jgi:hypothetical protein
MLDESVSLAKLFGVGGDLLLVIALNKVHRQRQRQDDTRAY